MKNLLDIFGDKNNPSTTKNPGILYKPGDKLEACITDTNRQVIKLQKDDGNSKYSATRYPNGTVVETKVTKKK